MSIIESALKWTSHALVGCLMFLAGNFATQPDWEILWILMICFILVFLISLVIAIIEVYDS